MACSMPTTARCMSFMKTSRKMTATRLASGFLDKRCIEILVLLPKLDVLSSNPVNCSSSTDVTGRPGLGNYQHPVQVATATLHFLVLSSCGLTWTPKVRKIMAFYGYCYGFRAIILHSFGV